MCQSEQVLDKYWVTQSGYFILATTVALGMGITDAKLLFCHGISDQSRDRKISMRGYNNGPVYHCFNDPFTVYFGIPYFNIPTMPLNESYIQSKRAYYTPYGFQISFMLPLENMLVL